MVLFPGMLRVGQLRSKRYAFALETRLLRNIGQLGPQL